MKRITLNSVPHRRSGFSLIELLMVIVIISILMALILPAIRGARVRAQIAAVSTEITKLDQAIAAFKNKYGVEPPSSLNIPTSATGWTPEDRQKITRVWDQFDFTTLGVQPSSPAPPGGYYPSSPVHLNGAECLVLFLGGINNKTSTSNVLIGFSNNPRWPWDKNAANRVNPFYDGFDPARLSDIDGDGAVEFLDSLPDQTIPYLFFSSQGKSYRKTNNATNYDDFDVHGGPNNPKDMTSIYLMPDGKTPQRSGGYQIISPGLDALYGVGGVYKDSNSTELTGTRSMEADNITNFSNGPMKP